MRFEVVGGAGPAEVAAILAAVAQVVAEQEARLTRRPAEQPSAWVEAVSHDLSFADGWSGLREGLRREADEL